MILIVVLIVAIVTFATILFMRQPSFGKKPAGERLARLQASPHYKEGTFQNHSFTPSLTGGASMLTVMRDFFFGKHEGKVPTAPVPVIKRDLKQPPATAAPQLTWFGHSSYLLQIGGKNILVDPVFSQRTSPVQYAGTKAFEGTAVYSAADMPFIDVLLITHNHYDHLDYLTVARLKDKVGAVVASLGVGADIESWGFDAGKIHELDWWSATEPVSDLRFTAAPGRHFSGRSFKRNETLWSSFVLEAGGLRLFLGGDSGYDSHFKEIGSRFGPFDLAILECGQYNAFWANIHMMPEETAQAAVDLNAKVLLPVHWGKFSLATHPWNESIKRVLPAAAKLGLPVIAPMIGQQVYLDQLPAIDPWWESLR